MAMVLKDLVKHKVITSKGCFSQLCHQWKENHDVAEFFCLSKHTEQTASIPVYEAQMLPG